MSRAPKTTIVSERRSLREVAWTWFTNAQFFIYSSALIVLLALSFVAPFMFIMIPTGYTGVMYRYFAGGTVTDRVWGEGLHVIPPWDTLTLYETRLIEQRLEFDLLSDEGLDLGVEVSIRYRPTKDMLGFLHQDVGPEYYERLVKPEVEAHVRKTFGQRPAHEIYGSAGDFMQELRGISMLGRVEKGETISSRSYISVQEIKLVRLNLPSVVESYIAAKYGQEQSMLEYEYKLAREEKEAERKRIEAAGIRDFNQIAASISHDLLRWRDIDATLSLAESTNSKLVLLGGGSGDKPLLFNLGRDSAATPPTADVSSTSPESPASDPTVEAMTPANAEPSTKRAAKPARTAKPAARASNARPAKARNVSRARIPLLRMTPSPATAEPTSAQATGGR